MQQELLEVKRERFSLKDYNQYILQGIWPKDGRAEVYLDDRKIVASVESWDNISALERFENLDAVHGERITMRISLPENLASYKKLKIFTSSRGNRILWFQISCSELVEKQKSPRYFLEDVNINRAENSCSIRGWVAYPEHVKIAVHDRQGNPLHVEIERMPRVDVSEMFKECAIDEKAGFFIELHEIPNQEFTLVFDGGKEKNTKVISTNSVKILTEKAGMYYKKTIRYAKMHGMKEVPAKVIHKFSKKNRPVIYNKWLMKHLPNNKELEEQRKTVFERKPLFSVVVPLYKTPEKYLRALIESLQKQTYANWELCLSDGSGADSPLKGFLAEYQQKEKRIKVVSSDAQLQISENTNAAIQIASGDFIVFADHDDELTAHALYECAKVLNEKPETEVIYSDEDKMSMDGHKFFQPHMKPDFNIDLLCTVNYICHLFVADRKLIDRVGMLRPAFDGAQDYDFILRCTEATSHIYHIPKILYHWRSHEDSTAENPESKMYAFEAGQRAVSAHFERIGVKAEVSKGEFLGLYRTKYVRDSDPLISILIPNKDHIDDLKRCMDSIEQKSTYKNIEYIIIENNSEEKETFQYYEQLEATNPKVHVVYWKGIFNYSAINNFGATYAKGEYLLLLNNDTEIINDDCIEELLGYCTRSDVGAVGARLYYDDDTIQHAGVVVGFGGIAGHCFVQQKRGFTGYCHRIICAQDYSAVTAACMMVKKKAFDEVGGLTEELVVAFNDIDFCLKLGKAGYHVVYNPYAELYHYESKSRGLEDTPEKVARFNREIATFEKRWPEILRDGDPYYNPNLTLDSQDFSLRKF